MKKERVRKLLTFIQQQNSWTTPTILKKAKEWGISSITLRRDLHILENLGYIQLRYGEIKTLTTDELDLERPVVITELDKKSIISIKANKLLQPNEKIFVSSGTTIKEFVKSINTPVKLLVSNCLETIIQASKNIYIKNLFLIGGAYNKEKNSCGGLLAEKYLNDLYFDQFFTSCDHVDEDNIIYCDNLEESSILKLVLLRSKNKVALIDSTKFNSKGLIKTFEATDFNHVITDLSP